MEPIAFYLAIDATRRSVLSARPHAPVVPDPEPRPAAARTAAAVLLRRLADRVQPAPLYHSG